jgi:hypothetical protein
VVDKSTAVDNWPRRSPVNVVADGCIRPGSVRACGRVENVINFGGVPENSFDLHLAARAAGKLERLSAGGGSE